MTNKIPNSNIQLKINIIYKDDSLIVLDKPAELPSVSIKRGEIGTLASWLLEKFPAQRHLKKGEIEAGLVHRLDNDTSGVIIAARTQKAYDNLRSQFSSGKIIKSYVALVIGRTAPAGIIAFPIAHHPRKKKKMMVVYEADRTKTKGEQSAITEFRLKKFFYSKDVACSDYSLLEVTIRTGVRHQIRVHLAACGHPIAGDRLYQNPKVKKLDTIKTNGHLLHACRVEFKHPATGKTMTFSSKPPWDPLQLGLMPEGQRVDRD